MRFFGHRYARPGSTLTIHVAAQNRPEACEVARDWIATESPHWRLETSWETHSSDPGPGGDWLTKDGWIYVPDEEPEPFSMPPGHRYN